MVLRPPAGAPLKPLALLSVAVLAVHLLLLQARPGTLSLSSPWNTRPLVTRVIQLPPPQVAEPAPTPPPAPPPPLASATAPVPAAPAPAPAPTTATTPAPATATAPDPIAEAPPAPAPAAPPAAPVPPAPAPPPEYVQTVDAAFRLPGSVAARYAVQGQAKGLPYTARANLVWGHDGTNYEARLRISAGLLGSREQVSTGRLTAQGLAPTRFGDQARTEQAAHFVRDQGLIRFSNNAPDVPLQAGAQDRLSVLLQLGAMLAADPARFVPGTRVDVQTAGVRDADTWTFIVGAPEELQIAGKPVSAIKLDRAPRHAHDQKVELWIASDMDYLPVRVRLTQPEGDLVDLLWDGADRV